MLTVGVRSSHFGAREKNKASGSQYHRRPSNPHAYIYIVVGISAIQKLPLTVTSSLLVLHIPSFFLSFFARREGGQAWLVVLSKAQPSFPAGVRVQSDYLSTCEDLTNAICRSRPETSPPAADRPITISCTAAKLVAVENPQGCSRTSLAFSLRLPETMTRPGGRGKGMPIRGLVYFCTTVGVELGVLVEKCIFGMGLDGQRARERLRRHALLAAVENGLCWLVGWLVG